MTKNLDNSACHEIDVSASAGRIYEVLTDVAQWPTIFPPTIHAVSRPMAESEEIVDIWATAGDQVKSWSSRRWFNGSLRIDFTQQVPAEPIVEMSGSWIIEPRGATSARVRLLHSFSAANDEDLRWIDQTVDTNSRAELESLKHCIESDRAHAELRFDFADEVTINGRLCDVYDFVNQADEWAERLPHVATVRLTERTPGVQFLEMDTRSPDGSTHTTASHRICFEPERIVYKQVALPSLMQLHTGQWTFTEEAGHVVASSAHSVVIEPTRIRAVLGPAATLDDAKAYLRNALSANSRATLGYAKKHVEAMAARQGSTPVQSRPGATDH